MRYRNFVPLISFLGVVGLLMLALFLPEERPTAFKGKVAPSFYLPQVGADKEYLSEKIFLGKITLVNFWASWCNNCRVEHPFLMSLQHYPGIQLIGVNYKDATSTITAWLQELGNPYKYIIQDESDNLAIDWGVYGTPETFLIDKQGIIIYRYAGALNADVWQNIFVPKILAIQKG